MTIHTDNLHIPTADGGGYLYGKNEGYGGQMSVEQRNEIINMVRAGQRPALPT